MQDLLKMLLLVGLVVSVTWGASWVTGRGPPTILSLDEGVTSSGGGTTPPPAEPLPAEPSPVGQAPAEQIPGQQPPAEKARIEEISQAEIDAELRQLEKTLSGGARNPGEVAADKPLPADLPVTLPSDI